MPIERLENRALVRVGGEDAEAFLENLVTCTVLDLASGEARFGALLSPQGKILFDFFIIRTDGGYLFDLPSALCAEFVKRLTFYRLRAKVTIERCENLAVAASAAENQPENGFCIPDPRHATIGYRIYAERHGVPEGNGTAYFERRLDCGIPEGGFDFEYGDAYPHETLMDQFAGVDFRKGCYVGQEVVSRMQHRSSARKRIVKVASEGPLPRPGTKVTADGKPAGQLGSVSGNRGLAMLRLDRVAGKKDLYADEARLEVVIPDWVDFGFAEPG